MARELASTVEALNAHPPMSLRVNRQINSRQDYLQLLQESAIEASPMPIIESGINLALAMDVERLPGFCRGACLGTGWGSPVGGRSYEIAAWAAGTGCLCGAGGQELPYVGAGAKDRVGLPWTTTPTVCNGWGRICHALGLQATLQQGDAANPSGSWARQCYDRILLDLPCSATGVIRRHPDIKYLRRETDIVNLVKLQSKILDAVWQLLKPGGVMLYATCSILPQENELQLQQFLSRQADAREDMMNETWEKPDRQDARSPLVRMVWTVFTMLV